MSLRVLMRGVVGPDVQAWQAFLAAQGLNPGPIDAIFGPKTRQATIAFQARHALDPDGIVGKNTFAKAAEFGFAFHSTLLFTQPTPDAQFALGEAVEFGGLAAPEIVRVELTADEQFVFPTVTLTAGRWHVANRLRVPGRRTIVAHGFDDAGALVASETITLFMTALDFGSLVSIPAGINKRLTPASPKLCCRRVKTPPGKPLSKNFSNHAWGTAIDIKIKGTLDPRFDGKTQVGLLVLQPFFNEEKFFWGAGFDRDSEDSMHFEAWAELIKEWQSQGALNV